MKRFKKPTDVKDLRENGRIILAHGEVTGHCHEITADNGAEIVIPAAEYFEELDGRRVLLVRADAPFIDSIRCHNVKTDGLCWIPAWAHPADYQDLEPIARESVRGVLFTHNEHGPFVVPAEHQVQARQGDVLLNPIGPGVSHVIRPREYDRSEVRQIVD